MSGSEQRRTITVASNLPLAVQMFSVDPNADPARPGGTEPERTASIAGERGLETAGGWGITRNVDAEMYEQWMAAHPQYADNFKEVSDDDIDEMRQAHAAYGYEVGLQAAEEAGTPEPAPPQPAPNEMQPSATQVPPAAQVPVPPPGTPSGPAPGTVP